SLFSRCLEMVIECLGRPILAESSPCRSGRRRLDPTNWGRRDGRRLPLLPCFPCQRKSRKKVRISLISNSGSSAPPKCPPEGITSYLFTLYIRSAQLRGIK